MHAQETGRTQKWIRHLCYLGIQMYLQAQPTEVIEQYFVPVDGKNCQMSGASDCFKWVQDRQMVEEHFGRKAEIYSIRKKRFFHALGVASNKCSHLSTVCG